MPLEKNIFSTELTYLTHHSATGMSLFYLLNNPNPTLNPKEWDTSIDFCLIFSFASLSQNIIC